MTGADFEHRNNKEFQNNSVHNSKANPVFMSQGFSLNDSTGIQDPVMHRMKLNEQFGNNTQK